LSTAKDVAGPNDHGAPRPARGLAARIRAWHDRLESGDPDHVAAVLREIKLWTNANGSCPEDVLDAVVGTVAALKDGEIDEARWLLNLAADRARPSR
jgi:hypothetical protein